MHVYFLMDVAGIPWTQISFVPPRQSKKPSAVKARKRARFARLKKRYGLQKARVLIAKKYKAPVPQSADGTYAFIDSKPEHDPTGWFLRHFWAQRRSAAEWTTAHKQLWGRLIPGYDGKEHTLRKLLDLHVERLTANTRFRRIMKRFLHLLRCHCIRKQVVGTEDLYTLTPVPDSCAVRVLDFASKKQYIFHTTTILKSIMSSLYYANYGIAQPQAPKNPYTNIPWSYGQKLVICQQILTNMIRNQRLPSEDFLAFCRANYNIALFYSENAYPLAKRAADHYFNHDPEMEYNYTDMVNNIYEHYLMYSDHRVALRAYVRSRTLPSDLQCEWTRLMTVFFIYENMNILDGYETYDQMMNDLNDLHRRSVDWWLMSPRQILRRLVPEPPSALPGLERTRSPTDDLHAAAEVIPVVDAAETNTLP